MCGGVVNTSNSASGGPGPSLARHVVSLDKKRYLHFVSLNPGVNGYRPLTAGRGGGGGNPAMD